jgi:hypothetical protein
VNGISEVRAVERALSLLVLLLAAIAGVSVAAAGAADRHAQMTAAYVFNFMKFVAWPAQAPADVLEICFLGAPDVRDALAAATADKDIRARRVIVRSIENTERAERCQVIYVDSQAANNALPLGLQAALTIGDATDFTREGGMIRLYTESNRLRFVVNVDNAKRAGIEVSSNLLKLATSIEQGAPP